MRTMIIMITATITTITPMTIMVTKTALHIMYRHMHMATDMITGTTTACCGSRRPGAWLWRWPSP